MLTVQPLTLEEIVSWYRSKQRLLANSSVSLARIRERTDHLPAAAADFDAANAIGRIDGWVSGAFDFHVLRASDGKDAFWRHADVATVDQLEGTYAEFLRTMQNPDEPATSS